MGVRVISRSSYPSGSRLDSRTPPTSNQPDPANYHVLRMAEVGPFLLIELQYLDCTNYEGKKILVFRGVTPVQLMNQRLIDPHFSNSDKYASPIARFVPTDEGWEMAEKFCKTFGG